MKKEEGNFPRFASVINWTKSVPRVSYILMPIAASLCPFHSESFHKGVLSQRSVAPLSSNTRDNVQLSTAAPPLTSPPPLFCRTFFKDRDGTRSSLFFASFSSLDHRTFCLWQWGLFSRRFPHFPTTRYRARVDLSLLGHGVLEIGRTNFLEVFAEFGKLWDEERKQLS